MFRQCLFKSIVLLFVIFNFAFSTIAGAEKVSAICENAALRISMESGVPLSVLRSISLTETGRLKKGRLEPWPWTVNMEGVGKWFDDYETAKAYVDRHFNRGARSFDVGCFQINYRWHHQAFSSIEQMFEPIENARYAARFLSELHDEFGDWSKAAGAYHSRTPKYAHKYTARFNRIRKTLEPLAVPSELASIPAPQQQKPAPRMNSFPLLQRGFRGQNASLVPLSQSISARFIDVSKAPVRPLEK